MATAKRLTDHDAIRHWVEERVGHSGTVRARGAARMLRVDFPGESFKAVSWQHLSLHQTVFENTPGHDCGEGSLCPAKKF
ncbi:MAG TPA: hypothetical protein VFZ59_00075 [Verrucomicrobiae bacterium]|nr:hypothetical protein [Verrucomicrobiae bacterium]